MTLHATTILRRPDGVHHAACIDCGWRGAAMWDAVDAHRAAAGHVARAATDEGEVR